MSCSEKTDIHMLAGAASEFARHELAAGRNESDRFPFGPFFDIVLQKAFELDFFHITLPHSIGGIGMGYNALRVVLDELSQQDASLAAIILTHCFAQEILLNAGTTDLLCNRTNKTDKVNHFLLACPLFNNPSEIRHVAQVIDKDNRIFLSGKLEYLVLGGVAGAAIVPAARKGEKTFSYYFIHLNQSSVSIEEPVLSLGLHCCPAVDIRFHMSEAVPVGGSTEGGSLFDKAAAKLYTAAAAISTGIMKGAFSEALAYTSRREQGGRRVSEWSEMQMILADMAMQVKIAEMVASTACHAVDENKKGWEQLALAAAIHIQQAAVEVTINGIQALGGVGYMQDFTQEKRFRDAKHIQACFGLTPMKKLHFLKQWKRRDHR